MERSTSEPVVKQYDVVWKDREWVIASADGARVASFASRAEAVQQARRLGQGSKLARVVVRYADGAVAASWLFHGEPRPCRVC
jgi:hypothetical protein